MKVNGTILMGYLTISANVRRYQTHDRWHFFLSGRKKHIGAQSLQLLRLSRLPFSYHAPQQPQLNALTARFRKSYSSVSMSRKPKKTDKIKERLVEFWQCNDTAFEWKMRLSCFPVLPDSAEAHITWGGTVRRLLIAYFMGNISAKKYQNAFTYVKL